MKKILLILVFFATFMWAFLPNDDYKVYKSKLYTIIYTDNYKKEASFIKENLDDFFKVNEKLFSFKMDEPLKLILVSNKHEIANAFSTQVPFNMSIFYNAGAHKMDYFSTKSWLNTLLVHELIHNYQMNAKKNKISKVLHKYLGNNGMPIWVGPIPIFTYPNFMLPTFLIEGNATYNEAIYNNGGRLLSGRLNALTNLLAIDNKITPQRLINDHDSFPFGEEKYVVGGFFMKYLVDKFGLEKVNSFFYTNSKQIVVPLLLETSFISHFGVSLKASIYEFSRITTDNAKGFKKAKGEVLATSLRQIYLNRQNNEINFISHDYKTRPILNSYNINKNSLNKRSSTWKNGKVFKIDGSYYTDSSAIVNNDEFKIGLFDENRNIKIGTQSKFVQDINGSDILYIDMKNAFMSSKLYLNEYLYDEVNSTALFDEDKNIYYFKQNGLKRELYKNKKKVLEFESFYSKLADIKDGNIYFIASSKLGSSLYVFDGSIVSRVHEADNIIDAKLISGSEVLATTLTSSYYEAVKTKLQSMEGKPFEYTVVLEKGLDFEFKEAKNEIAENSVYSEFNELEYSNTHLMLGGGIFLQSNFVDPLMFNQFSVGAYRDTDLDLAFVSYLNQRYEYPIFLSFYLTNRENKNLLDRGYGLTFQTLKEFYKNDLTSISSDFTFYLDDQIKEKNPSILNLTYKYDEFYPLSSSSYRKLKLEALGREDRGDYISQIKSEFNQHIFAQSYLNINGFYSKSTTDILTEARGIELTDDFIIEKDKTVHFVDGLGGDLYAKKVMAIGMGISKSFDFSKYIYQIPFSLVDETLFYNYTYYDLERTSEANMNVHVLGLKANVLFAHKILIPVIVKTVRNEYKEGAFSRINNQLKIELGVTF